MATTDADTSFASDRLRPGASSGLRGNCLSKAVLVGLLLLPISTALAAPPKAPDARCSRLLLQFPKPPPLGIESIQTVFLRLPGVIDATPRLGSLPNAWVLRVDSEVLDSPKKLDTLRSKLQSIGTDGGMGRVIFIERSAVWTSEDFRPNDPQRERQKSLFDVLHAGVASLRIARIPHTATVVAVVDSGILYDHVDLRGEMWWGNGAHGMNFTGGTPGDTKDYSGHGTMVAGALAATSPDTSETASIPWKKGVQLVIAKATGGRHAEGCTDDIVEAIDYAAKQANASIINLSLAQPTYSESLLEELTLLKNTKQRTLLVAAAGNRPFDLDSNAPGRKEYPTSYHLDNVISVEGVFDDGRLCGSAFGHHSVQLAAPGFEIYTTANTDDSAWTHEASGTSFAAPQVSAAAALISAYAPGWGFEEIRRYLVDSAHNPACDQQHGPSASNPMCGKSESGGMLNVDAATGAPVKIDAPEKGDHWDEGTPHEIRWEPYFQTQLCPKVDLYLSLDDGLNWSAPPSFPEWIQTLGGDSKLTVVIPTDVPKSSTARLALRCHDTSRLERWSEPFSID